MRPFTLSQFTTAIGNSIRARVELQGAWVIAELSDVRVSGGHCFMELIEKTESGQTVAKLRAGIWASRLGYIRQKFYASTGSDIATGMKVMIGGAATFHNVFGLSFNIVDIDPSYTLGDMERQRREILLRLQKEGIIDQNKRQEMPLAPRRIAVISAEGAAGYGDFMNQLLSNSDGFIFYPFLFGAVMQGEKVSSSVRSALDRIEQTIDLWDCVAIIRGGGATTDLNGFDDYELARRVATFPLPVVVGIGHERDRTVLDEIAHTRMKTPTAVASFFIDSMRGAWMRASQLTDFVTRYASDRLAGERRRLSNAESMIPVIVDASIKRALARLESSGRLVATVASGKRPLEEQKLRSFSERLQSAAQNVVRRNMDRLARLNDMVNVLSPVNTLRRGYSITRVDGKAVTDSTSLQPGTVIETELLMGSLKSKVEEICPKDN